MICLGSRSQIFWRHVFKLDALGVDILQIAFTAALALVVDPIASLIDTAFIGRLGPVPLAAVGVSISIFNQVSKVTIFPLSLTTSFVVEEDTVGRINREAAEDENLEKISAKKNEMKELKLEDAVLENLEKGLDTNSEMKELILEEDFKTIAYKSPTVATSNPKKKAKLKKEKHRISLASTAILLGCILGILQTIFLIFLAKPILSIMGVKSGSPMLNPAQRYLTLKALGAPAVLLSLAMQGVFRGIKDTRTPFLYAIVAGDTEYNIGPNSYICVPFGSQWCSRCTRSFSIFNFIDPLV